LKKFFPDIGYTIVFGVLSIILGVARFPVPGSEVFSDLREIPLLIAVFHIRHPVFFIAVSLLTSSSMLFYEAGFFSSTFLMHLVGLLFTWFFYTRFIKGKAGGLKIAFFWAVWVAVYYTVLVVPVMIIADIVFKNDLTPFVEIYPAVLKSLYFEYLSSTMVTVSYLLQFLTKLDLKRVNLTLEDKIAERTNVLNHLNEELRSSHEEIMKLNSNLEQEVVDRTVSLKMQLEKLNAYAFANSHEVRAPLARILGLLLLAELEKEEGHKEAIYVKIKIEAVELDQIIRKMNRILEAERLIDLDRDHQKN
jgi:signal transduction histidine kinase